MASTASNFHFDREMLKLLHQVDYTPGTQLFIALFTTAPALDGTGGVEVSTSGTAYARVSVDALAAQWSGPTGVNREFSNINEIQFATPTANWGTIVASGAFDASTGGNLLFVSSALSPKTVSNGDGAPKILVGAYKLSRAT